MCELLVGDRPIVPIRGIPLHTGNAFDVVDVAGLLCDPRSYGPMGAGLAGHWRCSRDEAHRMLPLEFQGMSEKITTSVQSREPEQVLLAHLLPGVFVFRANLEESLYELWHHFTSEREFRLDRNEFVFNPAPLMTPNEQHFVYAGFEDLRTADKLSAGHLSSQAERVECAGRILKELQRRAANAGMPFEPREMPGPLADAVDYVKRRSKVMMALGTDAVRSHIRSAGYSCKGGDPGTTNHARTLCTVCRSSPLGLRLT